MSAGHVSAEVVDENTLDVQGVRFVREQDTTFEPLDRPCVMTLSFSGRCKRCGELLLVFGGKPDNFCPQCGARVTRDV